MFSEIITLFLADKFVYFRCFYFFFSCCWCFEISSFLHEILCFFREFAVSFGAALPFLPAPFSGSVMLLFISFKEMLLLLSSCCSSIAAYRFCRSILNSFTICLHTLSGSGFE